MTAKLTYEELAKQAQELENEVDWHRKIEGERLAHLAFFEKMERIDQAIRQATDIEKMMSAFLATVLEIFKCDRAWLMFPCDPDAPAWTVPMECTTPEYPGVFALKKEIPTSGEMVAQFKAALESRAPLVFDPTSDRPLPDSAKQFSIQSAIIAAIHPKIGKPWLWGVSQCSHARAWTKEEQRFFKEVGRRVADVLSILLFLRDLEESEEQYRTLFDMESDALALIDLETGNMLDVNTAFIELYGYSKDEILGMKNTDFSAEPDRTQQATQSRSVYASLRYHKKKDGTVFPTEITASVFEHKGRQVHIAAIRDITDRKRLEAQLQQAHKMEAIGTLAGGIAHDFNNLLMGVQGRTSLMQMDTDAAHPHFEHLKGIENYVQSATDLTRQLLAFARGGKYEVKPTDVNNLIVKSAELFGRTKKEITIHKKIPREIWSIEADQSQIEQVLLNMYVNAWQSMPGGGDLYLETENVVLDDGFVRPYELEPGKYVKIAVTDTGVGMDKATQARIFDPFFTTKEMGRGTGLGLASTYGIIKNHGGIIHVDSEKGKGATFNIYLPASEQKVMPVKEPAKEISKGYETILLVDDEDIVINVGKEMLKKIGYKVLIARGGKAAVELYEDNQDEIDMVILDMIMPDVGGGEAYDRLQKINPDIKVLLSSGYSINGQATEILNRGCDGFIQKPFNVKDLSQKIREILDK